MESPNNDSVAIEEHNDSLEASDTPKSHRLRKIGAIVVAAILLLGGFLAWKVLSKPAKPVVTKPAIRIGLSLVNIKIVRWAKERDIMAKKASDMGATLTTLEAGSDNETQISQIEQLISQKVDVLIVVAHDAVAVAPAIIEARKAGIKVIAYDRLIFGTDLDMYVSFDSVKVGQNVAQYVIDNADKSKATLNIAYVGGAKTDNNATLVRKGAMQVLSPLVKSRKVNLVYDDFTDDWSPDIAYKNINTLLAKGVKLDGVVTAYDGLAFGSIQALGEHGLAGKIPVTGQDGELTAMQRLVQGTQTMSAYKPGRELANKAIELAIDLANGTAIKTTATISNGQSTIPSVLFDPIPVTKDNIKDTVIKDGTYTTQDVYKTP